MTIDLALECWIDRDARGGQEPVRGCWNHYRGKDKDPAVIRVMGGLIQLSW